VKTRVMPPVAFVEGGEETAQVRRRLAGLKRIPQVGFAIIDDAAVCGVVILVETNPHTHVEQITDRGPVECRAPYLWKDQGAT
jgi:hypothetical protein